MSYISTSNPNAGTITVVNSDGSITILPGSPIAPYPGYPVIPTQFAKDNFTRKNMDNTIVNETDGGYEYTRPRNLNFKRRDYTLGYQMIPMAELEIIRNFVEQVGNCGGIFTWVDPTNLEMYLCRLTETPMEVYAGFSNSQALWNVTFKLRTQRLLSSAYYGYLSVSPRGWTVGGVGYTSLTVSQFLQPSISQVFLFVNGMLQNLADVTIAGAGTFLQLNNGLTVNSGDDICAFSFPIGSATVSTQIPTMNTSTQLQLSTPVDGANFGAVLFINGSAQPAADCTLDVTGLLVNLSNGVTVAPTDKLRIAFFALPLICTVSGAKNGVNNVFNIVPGVRNFLFVLLNGLLIDPASYTPVGNLLTLTFSPVSTDDLRVYTL